MGLKEDILSVFENMNSLYKYTEVTNPPANANPALACWYVEHEGDYEVTADETLQAGVTYYTRGYEDCNRYMSDGLGRVIKKFVADCTLTPDSPVTGSDSSPSGAFSGEATVSWQIAGTTIADKLYEACIAQGMTDDSFALAFSTALTADLPTWSGKLEGETTPTGSSPTPTADTIVVMGVYNASAVSTKLKATFRSMRNMYHEGDKPNDKFAGDLADAITTYYTTAQLTGKGSTHLSGCAFAITVTAPTES